MFLRVIIIFFLASGRNIIFPVYSLSSVVESAVKINASSEQLLINKILDGYDSSIRPVLVESDVIYVNVSVNQFSLLIVVSVIQSFNELLK